MVEPYAVTPSSRSVPSTAMEIPSAVCTDKCGVCWSGPCSGTCAPTASVLLLRQKNAALITNGKTSGTLFLEPAARLHSLVFSAQAITLRNVAWPFVREYLVTFRFRARQFGGPAPPPASSNGIPLSATPAATLTTSKTAGKTGMTRALCPPHGYRVIPAHIT